MRQKVKACQPCRCQLQSFEGIPSSKMKCIDENIEFFTCTIEIGFNLFKKIGGGKTIEKSANPKWEFHLIEARSTFFSFIEGKFKDKAITGCYNA